MSGSKRLLVNSGNEDSAAWNKAWEAYKAKNTGNQQAQDKWALGNLNSQSNENTVPSSFKQKCVEKSSSNAYSQSSLVEDYELVLEWCTTNV
ncbi:hypothetical protein MHF_0321 [Mycoplasma haemofelis Ohio2]|uniref:Uncharacterized protein n=1 Tax=Mycoplasma haemofelis (strain Ohio2) TaxID=859194 RepID=F6FGS7_MYCHI|nr:hypothetical protein MHF_0321 [Mycoplasma haemofelis Ohio2]